MLRYFVRVAGSSLQARAQLQEPALSEIHRNERLPGIPPRRLKALKTRRRKEERTRQTL
jgi:hypothetical protein